MFKAHVIVLGLVWMVCGGCSKPQVSKQAMLAEVSSAMTNALHVRVEPPPGWTNALAAVYEYSSFTEGSHTKVLLVKVESETAAAEKWLGTLRERGMNMLVMPPPAVLEKERSHADWFAPADYGDCEAFTVSTDASGRITRLMGFVARTPTNRVIFLHLRVTQK